MSSAASHAGVSRAGAKLAHACDAWKDLPIQGAVAADLGCHAGGFTEVWLSHGASRVYAVDKGYGVLDWKLRNDPRVVVLERTDAQTVVIPEQVDVVSIDVGWTPQSRILPHALSILREGGHIVSLLKPHYERVGHARGKSHGMLSLEECIAEKDRVVAALIADGVPIVDVIASPITGAKGGNLEFLLHLIKPTVL